MVVRRCVRLFGFAAAAAMIVTAASSTPAGAAAACRAPTPWKVPSKHTVVGKGTQASCTQAALRRAVAGGGYVTFACGDAAVTIPVTSPLSVTRTTFLNGGKKVSLKGGGSNRIIVAQNGTKLSVRNLTFLGGSAPRQREAGGIGGAVAGLYRSKVEVIGSTFKNNRAGRGGGAVAVWTDSTLTVSGSTFTGNRSWYGGAVYSLLSPLTVVNSTFTSNSTVTKDGFGDGGAIGTDGGAPIEARTGGQIRICGSTFTGNTGHGSGGAAYLWGYAKDKIVIERTTFTGNVVKANGTGGRGIGGAARVSIGPTDWGKNGTVVIRRSSFLSNKAGGGGGALYLDCVPKCSLANSTFYGNRAAEYGGAIFGDKHHDNGVTYAKNVAGGHGGALFGAKFVLKNTVFSGNSAGNPWGQAMTCSSTGTGAKVMQWLASSKDGSTSCIPGVAARNPKLTAPAKNGGPTLTMMPLSTSPVLRAGAECPTVDQRGRLRPASRCDLGAVQRIEVSASSVPAGAVVRAV